MLEMLARGGAVGVLLTIAVTLVRGPTSPARITGFLFCLAAAAHALTQLPEAAALLAWGQFLVWPLSVAAAGLFWAFIKELFADNTYLSPVRFAPAAVLLAAGLAAVMLPSYGPTFWLIHHLIGAALFVDIMVSIARGRRDDLVETRRRLRGPVLVAAAIYGLAVVSAEVAAVGGVAIAGLSPIAATALLILSLAAAVAFLRADQSLFAPPRVLLPAPPDTANDERHETAKLETLMRVERPYRDDTLSIGKLAIRLDLPEYRLRRLINQTLGYRNFSAYLTRWRLDEAKEALADPAQRAVPISTIALDAGFGSLGPFNRAFKDAMGITPSAYRERSLNLKSG